MAWRELAVFIPHFPGHRDGLVVQAGKAEFLLGLAKCSRDEKN